MAAHVLTAVAQRCINMEVPGHHSTMPPRSPLRTVLSKHLSAFSVCALCVCKTGRFYFSEVLSQAFSTLHSRQDTQAQLSVFTVSGCVVFHVGAPAS